MNFGVIPASAGTFPVDGPDVAKLARVAEEVGFDSIWIGEHVVMSSEEAYPGADINRVGPSPTGTLPDPIEWLTYVAACTESILLGTAILLVPLHHPAVMAKRLATLDRLSGGRARIGIGVGWSEVEYATVGQSFASRGRRCDETIAAMRCLWRDSPATFTGEFFDFPPVYSVPQPVHGAVPIFVGGDSDAAAKRAGRIGDGYFPFGKDVNELARLLQVMRVAAQEAGRDPDSIELTGLGSGRPEVVERLAELGFTRLVMFLPDLTPQGMEHLWERIQMVSRGVR
ncbi:MAG: putative oxidoreductase [Acidimicrobiia bacterium]|nr:putative oxidoreductase [Acidimicrobiia bacterium]